MAERDPPKYGKFSFERKGDTVYSNTIVRNRERPVGCDLRHIALILVGPPAVVTSRIGLTATRV
jgi:hypothetical protein